MHHTNFRRFWQLTPLILAISTSACTMSDPVSPKATVEPVFSQGGFDEYGYNEVAGIFNGIADGIDRNLDGLYFGSPSPYVNDKLAMKWNSEWDRGNDEGWSNPPYRAWIDNHWNGKNGGSGETWLYRIKWVGPCGSHGTPTGDGGYCIWGQFEVIMSHGTSGNQHFWDAHATPAGFGN